MRYRAGAPVIDRLLKEAGFDGDNPVSALVNGAAAPGKATPTEPKSR